MTADRFEVRGNEAVYPNGWRRPLSIGERARAVAEDFVRSTSLAGDRHMNIDGAEVIRAEQDQQRAHVQDPNLAGQSELFDEPPEKPQAKSKVKKERGFFDVHYPPEAKAAKMSNDILRSGLFSVRKRVHGQNVMVERKEIATIGDAKIYLTGMELDQEDYRVYEGLIQQFTENGTEIVTNIPGMLRIAGYQDTQKYRESLLETLRRLNSCRVEITTKRYRYLGGLVNGIAMDKTSDKVTITLGRELAVMFSRDNWSRLDVSERERLGRNDLAFRIFNLASTHRHMFPYTRQILRKLSDNENIPQKKFNQKLKHAVELINVELGDLGWYAEIKGELLEIKRTKILDDESTIYLK